MWQFNEIKMFHGFVKGVGVSGHADSWIDVCTINNPFFAKMFSAQKSAQSKTIWTTKPTERKTISLQRFFFIQT
jgi:hypothetical protein